MTRVVLWAHGAGKQAPNYADAPLRAVTELLGVKPPSVSVFYADICEVGTPLLAPVPLSENGPTVMMEPPHISRFKMAFAMQVQSNLASIPPSDKNVTYSTLSSQFLADLILTELNEVIGYLFSPDVFQKIQARMWEGLDEATKLGDEIVVASHSLGALIAFDALRALGDRYHVSTLLTLGSPLGILRRLGNRGPELGDINYATVREWLNFYDTTDPISNPLGALYPLRGYRLRDVFVDVAPLPPASHDYFRNGEVLFAIAAALRETPTSIVTR